MYFVNPRDSERHALRMLILYRKGCSSFKLLRTVNNTCYSTFKEALIALGLAEDDNEWDKCIEEASLSASPIQLRELFVNILLNCAPNRPSSLWPKYQKYFSEYILYQKRIFMEQPNLDFNQSIYYIALYKIDNILKMNNQNILNYGLLAYNIENVYINRIPQLIKEELSYDCEKLKEQLIEELPNLNMEQKSNFSEIIKRTNSTSIGIYKNAN